jgi:short-subunit dehydrogenase
VINMLSMAALVSLPVTGTYSASKAAFFSVTRSIRAELAAQGTIVVGVLAVQTETAIGARLPPPRMTPDEVAFDAIDAVQAGKNEEVVAGSLTQGISSLHGRSKSLSGEDVHETAAAVLTSPRQSPSK